MNAVLNFPEIAAEIAPPASEQVPATLKATVLAQFAAIKPDITALGAKYANVAYDVTTTKGMEAAKAARLDLRENGRFMLQRAEKRLKDEVNELKGLVSVEVAQLIEFLRPVEDAIHGQITAEETRKAEQKAKAEKDEADRKQRLQDGIAGIRAMLERAAGQPADKIDAAIKAMEKWTFPAERWQEFAVQAANATCETLEKLRALHAQAVEAARLREENARLQAELAARPAAPPPAPQIVAEPHRGPAPVAQPIGVHVGPPATATPAAAPVTVNEDSQPTITQAGGAKADAATGEIVAEAPAAAALDAAPQALDPPMSIGAINERLAGPKVDAACLKALGFEPKQGKGAAKLFDGADWPKIKAALIEHLRGLA